MAKRISRKLLVGLGSVVTFGAVGTVSGFGVKSIIDSTITNDLTNKLAINKLDEVSFTDAPDYNVATADMFVDTTNLKRFHFGNTLIGQTVTPYGWLGVFDEPNKSTRIALTGWNGEVIWVNEPNYQSGIDKRNYNVYDMEYDFKNDLIFVLRTWSSNGLLNDSNEGFPKIELNILDAKTGREFQNSAIKWKTSNDLEQKLWQNKALNGFTRDDKVKIKGLKSAGYLNWQNQQNREQSKNLYQLDIASSPSQKNMLVTWMPDFMRLTKNFGSSNASIMTLKDFIEIWQAVAVSWIILPENIRQDKPAEYSRYFDLIKSEEINKENNDITIKIGNSWLSASQFYLIANPFFTIGKDPKNVTAPFYIMHILFADKNGNVYHKIIGWDENITNADTNGLIYRSKDPKKSYDKTQKIDWQTDNFGSTGGFLVEKGDKKGNPPSWTKRQKYTDTQIINANTRINKNMFDNNSIVLAYPYGVGSHLAKWYPIFNVAQVYVEPTTGFFYSTKDAGGDLKKKVRQFYFGRDIANKNQEMAHYPGQNGKNNINQTYNRLISVSPFDNTFIYAEKPNINHSFFDQGANDSIKNWAGFFIGKAFRDNNTVRPFFIWNSTSGGNTSGIIDTNMTSFEKLYEDGFTFDLRSFVTSTKGGAQPGLNLYFNQNGNAGGTAGTNGIKSRKIGMISDIFRDISVQVNSTNLWVDNGSLATKVSPTNAGQWYGITGTKIEQTSFSTINHSRADLEKWYPRTFWNNTNPSNLITANSTLNGSTNDHRRAVASKQFNSKLSGADFDSSNKSVDLVSAWQENQANYNRLIVKRPLIKVKNASVQEKLPVITEYNYANENDLKANVWIPKDSNDNLIKTNLVLTREQDVPNVSFKIFSSWKDQFRMQSFGNDTSNINPSFSARNDFRNPEWIDKRANNAAKAVFGRGNNAIVRNSNKLPLRLMLKIVKPTGSNLPSWFNSIQQDLYNLYPVEAIGDETTFSQVLNEFINKKTELLNMSDANNGAVGLANLKIEAYLTPNPAYMTNSDNKIYKNSDEKMVIDSRTGQRIIYKDEYRSNRTIYDQSQTEYTNFNRGGFGEEVKAVVQESWNTTVNPANKIKVNASANLLKDQLVRKSANDQKLFTFEYENGNQNLIISPIDANWLRTRLWNFQRMINMKAVFEYKTTDNSSWATLITTNDAMMKQRWQANSNTFLLPTSNVMGITKLRIKLVQNNINENNSFVNFADYQTNIAKFTSADQEVGIQKIAVDKNWIVAQTLTNAGSSLAAINANDITGFESRVLANISNAQNRAQVKLVYKFENSSFDLTAEQLAAKILEKFNNFNESNQGVFALWNGTNGQKLIQAKFALKNPSGKFQLITTTNQSPSDSDLTNDVKSSIKSKIDLQAYISELQANPISAQVGAQPGTIQPNSLNVPGKSGNAGAGRFFGKSFNDINNILKTQGISIKFKQEDQNGNWSNWLDLNQVTTYSTKSPKIQLGFVYSNNPANIELVAGTTNLPNGSVYTLKLNLPKLVKLPTNLTTTISNFNAKNAFTNNTFNLNVDNTKLTEAQNIFINDIKTASQGNSQGNDFNNLASVLVFKYKLGNSPDWKSAQDLKTYLATQTNVDQTSNELKIKIELAPPAANTSAEFELDRTQTWEHTLLTDNNTTIKKWLHGKAFEDELKKNNIGVTGSKSNLTYTLNGELAKFSNTDGKYSNQQLRLQYQLIDNANNPSGNWIDGYMPSRVNANINKIQVKIVRDKSIAANQQVYVYGPEEASTPAQAVSIIDLSQIATLITIDPAWFDQIPLVNTKTDSKTINAANIKNWENQIYAKIPEAADQSIRNKIIIKYEFAHHRDLTADNLFNVINTELTKYDNQQHHGIVKLYDKNAQNADQSGYKIKATFEKVNPNDPTIQFVNKSGTSIDGDDNKNNRTGVVNTTNITTTINLTDWINNLMTSLTVVKTNQAGVIPKDGLIPPQLSGAANSKLFASQTFKDIEIWLKAAGVKFWWTKDESNNRDWKEGTAAITQYDPTKKKLWFALDNQSTNLILTLGNNLPTLNSNNDNKANPITIKLDAPATINVHPNQLSVIAQHISGNTKNLVVKIPEITKEIEKIKKALGTGFEDAPLTILLTVGNESPTDYKTIASELQNNPDDVDNGIVAAQFAIDQTAANASKFQIIQGGEDKQQIINDDGTIKVFINDKNIFNDLKATVAKGTSKALQLEWKNGISINEQDGVLTANGRGRGLRIEYTFKADLQGADSDPVGTDITQGWTRVKPTTFRAGIDNNLLIRIRLVDPTKFIYNEINKKITIDLTKLKSIINLDSAWLNKQLVTAETELANFGLTQIDAYEKQVFAAMQIPDNLKNEVVIKYEFNKQTNLDKNQLNQKITTYRTNNATENNLGILKFINNHEQANPNDFSEKIVAKFALKTEPNNKYELEIKGTNAQQLDTSNIISTIDVSHILNWLKSIKVSFSPTSNNKILINIPAVNASQDLYFNKQAWNKVEQTLRGFGVIVEYRKVMNNNQPAESEWSDQISSIDSYNPTIGKFQIRFKFDGQKSANLKLKIDNQIYSGKDANVKTSVTDVNLNIKLVVNVSQALVDAFKNTNDVVSGNTKYLSILESAQTKMTNDIKAENLVNNQAFNSLDLQVEYKLGNAQSTNQWLTRQAFIDSLKNAQTDQTTNEITFRFAIAANQQADFTVANTTYTLSANKPVTDQSIKIKYFVHTNGRETKANSVLVRGTQDQLQWDFSTFGKLGVDYEEKNGTNEVFLKSQAGSLLRLEFTTKNNPTYDEPVSNNPAEISTKWVSQKPINIKAEEREKLYIRIKPISDTGIVYQAAYNPGNGVPTPNPLATIHKVQTQIQTKININKQWLNDISISANEIEIRSFNESVINTWITQLRTKIKTENNLTDNSLVDKINIEFTFDQQGGLNAKKLVEAINTRLNNYSSNELGIFHLWNPITQNGIKINAKFIADNSIVLNPTNGSLADDLNTKNIYTQIDFREYEKILLSTKTSVTKKPGGQITDINGFTPPNPKGNWNNKTYDQVIARLTTEGISVKYAKENSGPWVDKTSITSYNPQTRKIFLSFTNIANNNVRLQLAATTVIQGQQNVGIIGLPLAVPKQININANDLANLQQSINFRNNTKNIEYNATGASDLITKILKRNGQENGEDYSQAPLKVKFKVGDTGQWKSLDGNDNLKAFLAQYPDDLTNREIKYQFSLENANPDEWIFDPAPNNMLEGVVAVDNNSPLKIFINDKGLFNDLSNPKLDGSTSQNLKLNWSEKQISINNQTGVITAKEVANPTKVRGVGLRVEFSYKKGLTGADNEPTNNDPFQGWSPVMPTTFNPNISTELLMRIRLVNEKYTYQQINQKITIDLSNLPTIIELTGAWLNQSIVDQKIPLEQLKKSHFEAYEQKVWQAANLGPADRKNVLIEYTFDGQQYRDIDGLMNSITNYKNRHINDVDLGILQLWNQVSGEKISTKFIKANDAGNYQLNVTGTNNHDLDLSKVITTVDLTEIKKWLESIKVANTLKPGTTNGISSITIPSVNAPNDQFFNGKDWSKVEQALISFGAQIQYRPVLTNQQPDANWANTTTGVNQYDPNIGKFEIRFKFDGQKSKNIKLKIDQKNWDGDQANLATDTIQVKLQIKLVVKLDPALINQFTSAQNVIEGNTKQLRINEQLEQKMIDEIKKQNIAINNEFAKVQLKVTYQLGDGMVGADWLDRQAFIQSLLDQNIDQETNKVVFRFEVDQSQVNEFSVANDIRVLSDKQAPSATTKIKYFINKANWENAADQLIVRGTNSNLVWDFEKAFGANKFKEENGKVYLLNPVGNAMQLQFTTKANADYTDDLNQVSDNINDLATKWVRVKPTSLAANVTQLKMRIIPVNGFVYEPAILTNAEKARVHNLNLQIQTEIKVNKAWFTENPLVNNSIDITSLDAQMITTWENGIYQKIQTTNSINETTAKEIKIKYIIEQDNNKYLANELINQIKKISANFNNNYLGILQLWNGKQGLKLHAIFESPNPKYILKVDGVTGDPAENDLKELIQTQNIYTTVSMVKYIEVLKTQKTDVELDPNVVGKLISFTPKPGQNSGGIFDGKTYDQIAKRLNEIGVKIEFSKTKTGPWKSKNDTTEYDTQLNSLYLTFTIESSNIKLQLDAATTVEPNNNSKNFEIRLPLQVPKYIKINQANIPLWKTIKQDFNFNKDTKNIDFNLTAIQKFVQAIKDDNATQGQDEEYKKAPLEILFQVGNLSFTNIDNLKQFLLKQSDDLTSRTISFKFKIADNQTDNWKLEKPNDEYTLLTETDTEIQKLKIYINDKNAYDGMRTMVLRGSDKKLEWPWPQIVQESLNETTGILTPKNASGFGRGLKLQFSFNRNANAEGNNHETQWASSVPKSFDPNKNFTHVYIRIKLVNQGLYKYDYADQIIELSLENIQKEIALQVKWLNQQLRNGNKFNIEQLSKDDFKEYEKNVKEMAVQQGLDQSLKDKFTIKYTFNNSSQNNNDLYDIDQLFKEIEKYKVNKSQTSLGILQLWNQSDGVKIGAVYVDAITNDNYVLDVQGGNNYHVIDTTNVETEIDFSKVMKWILNKNTTKIKFEPGNTSNSINRLIFPDYQDATDNTFNNIEWNKMELALASFGVNIQWRSKQANGGGSFGIQSSVNSYDENIGLLEFKFRFDEKAKNIKIKLDPNSQDFIPGQTGGQPTNWTQIYEAQLEIKLNIRIEQAWVENQFINVANVISGDTKNININQAKEAELIKYIKDQNANSNSLFNNAPLIIKYYLGNANDSKIVWRTLDDFKKELLKTDIDQISNKVIFKFEIDPNDPNSNQFKVNSNVYTLYEPANDQPADWKVKFFINQSTWENKASNVAISGTTSNVRWDFNSLASANNLEKEIVNLNGKSYNKIYIKINGHRALQVQFSTKNNIQYSEQSSDNLTDLNQKWITIQPQEINPPQDVKHLYIRLVAVAGFVYEPEQNKSAKSHRMDERNLKIEIQVNPNDLNRSLTIKNPNGFVTDLTKDDLKTYVQEVLTPINSALATHVVIGFKFNNKIFTINSNIKNQQQIIDKLYDEIQNIIQNKNGFDKGILQLWNGQTGKKIEAFYDLLDPNGNYSLVDQRVTNPNDIGMPKEAKIIVTDHINTLIDLKAIINDLKVLKVNVELDNHKSLVAITRLIMPAIPEGTSSGLQGLSWSDFETKLKSFGVDIQARAVVQSGQTQQNWTSLNDVKKYDDTKLELELRFKLNRNLGSNILLSVLADQDVDVNTAENQLPSFVMNLNAPARVVVSQNLIDTFIKTVNVNGDTKNLKMDQNADQTLIDGIIKENMSSNSDIFSKLNGRLEIQYFLAKDKPNDQQAWKKMDQFINDLSNQKLDKTTNQIWFRLYIKSTNQQDEQIFQIDSEPQILFKENISLNSPVKIFINETGFSEKIKTLKAIGSTENFVIQGLQQWQNSIPKGLIIQWSNQSQPTEDDDSQWSETLPQTLNSKDRKLWVRFKVEDGYKYENAKATNSKYSDKFEINTTELKIILNLKTEWLKKIKISGNTKDADINEDQVKQAINDAQILPDNNPDLVELQYNIKGQNDWLSKEQFIEKLKKLAGSKDKNNFILLREELEIRFNINKSTEDYGMNIDDQNVTNDNRNQFNVQMVNDANNQNQDFEGYINIDKLNDFIVDNFAIQGTTTSPRFIVKKREELNTKFAPYISNNLFDIKFSSKFVNNNWNWEDKNSVLTNGKFIGEDGLIQKGIEIDADKKFALKFTSLNNKYQVYQADQKQVNGYVLDVSKNVKITIEITNPFTAAGKTLGVWTRDDNKQAKYYQGQGGFRIVVANKDNLEIDQTNIESAQEFLNNTSSIKPNEKNALEFVYHVFGSSASNQEIEKIQNSINDYEKNDWKQFPVSTKNLEQWSGDLKLRVGDYVAVAIRVKKEFSTGENAFVLKGGDHSMILPVMNVGTETKYPGRVSGYKIKTEDIKVDNDSIVLTNMLNLEIPPLDGWTQLSRLNLKQDQLGNYLGVKLKLQVYSEFYKDASDNILISGSKAKLIKRKNSNQDSNVESVGYYKNDAGADLTDKDGNKIEILKNKQTKRLSEPIKNNNPTKEQELDMLGNGAFRLDITNQRDLDQLSLFRNQDIDLKLEAFEGNNDHNLPDFYLDDPDAKINLRPQISPKIKFIVENEQKISYEWNFDDFLQDKIEYQSPQNQGNKKPENGSAQIKTLLKLVKIQPNQKEKIIEGSNQEETIKKIAQQIKEDFSDQLTFELVRINPRGGSVTLDTNNIYQFNDLENKDRIILKIVAKADDLYYAEAPRPLIINVNGLVEAAPDQSTLQFLRVKQGGYIDGQGSFKVLVSNPNDDNEDDYSILKGWKFMVRVWDKDETIDENGKRKIKIDWTDDQARIRGLANGDKVEWKLVSEDGNPVKEAYYNTIALEHKNNPNNGQLEYNFAQIQYQNGDSTYQRIKEGIGDYPENDEYPQDSGFIIKGLKDKSEIFQISKENFAKVITQLQPSYVGINTQGTIHFDQKFFDESYWVNTNGELYVKKDQVTFEDAPVNKICEIPLTEFLDHVTFYTHDPVIANYQGGFKFSGNDVNINNHLTNGDQMWATFDTTGVNDNSDLNNNDPTTSLTTRLLDVSGLKDIIDPMSPLWYVLMALAGIATLGTAALIAFLVARHKKLKGKN